LEIPIVSPRKGDCVRWIVGNKESAAIHSEPDFSHMPGTEEQIKDLARNWNQEYITPPVTASGEVVLT
jgi:hypothetical protein